MYEELVRCLREHAKPWNCADNCICKDATQRGYGSCSDELAKLAADAIEELSKRVEGLEAAQEISPEAQHFVDTKADSIIDGLQDLLASVKERPRWVPVTERLPEEDGWYQVYAPSYSGGSSSGLKNIKGNMYSAFKNGKWSIEVGYHKRPGCVKAWMPLPEPPKEEE